ncbi:MAG: UDP-N-acetylglucosamine 1-carboxyvinyltransferase [Candidatus Pacebacteria bacterium]|nr:UDP-N-acetylglucosamine 1-carboxyvinyltransferase [Candidatus Paceibacterota bacterium]
MEKFIINGGKPLEGEIEVMGSKNATTPILSACLLTKEECIIDNVPRITDVMNMIKILQSMGVEVERIGERTIRVKAGDNVDPEKMDFALVGHMRSSILLLGSLLSRFHKFKIKQPGGCIIGARPIGTHFDALEALGATINQDDTYYYFDADRLIGKRIVLKEFSVTATENLMMAATLAEGTTTIRTAAIEPHVQDLGRFLRKMGANIKGGGFHTIEIQGVDKLHGANHSIQPDPIEAGTFAIAAGATKGDVLIKNIVPNDLDLVLEKLKEAGVLFDIEDGKNLHVKPTSKLGTLCKIEARTYPGLPTDLQAPFAVLATQTEGNTLVHDTLYEGRMNYINELTKMGANAVICDPHRAIITGPTPLYGKDINSFDLRAGATMIIAALLAQGQSTLSGIEQVDRGYEAIEERLQKLGADIRREKI